MAEWDDFIRENPDITHVDAMLFDLCGRAYGKRIPAAQAPSLFADGTPVCAAMSLVDVNGNTADPMGYGFSDGDPDGIARPVSETLVRAPWTPGLAQVLCEPHHAITGEPFWYDPREVLKRTVAMLHADGYFPVVACELEFYLVSPARDDGGRPLPARSPANGRPENAGNVLSLAKLDEYQPVLDDVLEACRIQRVPATTIISEYGAGQFEVNLEHRADPVRAADDALMLRRIVAAVARGHGMEATFMSKPFPEQAGSGLHIHASMAGPDGNNIFAGPDGETMIGAAAAGLGATLHEAMAILAPNLNVYRRFRANNFTPVTRDWGVNNRSVAFRVPASKPAARRIEHRAAGAEANPYLVLAAVLAGMHHGLKSGLQPAEPANGNAGAEVDPSLPLTFPEALAALRTAEILPRWLGADYPAIYAAVKEAEYAAFMETISRQEYEWYL